MNDNIRMRRARIDEAPALTDLAMRAKAHWGYDGAFMDACLDELTVQTDRIASGEIWVADRRGETVGLLEVIVEEGVAEVYLCFVEPAEMGCGIGRLLWEKAEAIALKGGVSEMGVDSDPNAEGFYEAMGAVRIGEAPSGSIPGRMLPRLVKPLR
jgi:GNAT superfamily N-acetyltransferase